MLNNYTNYSAELYWEYILRIYQGLVHKIVYYMIQGLIMPLIYYIIYLPYGTHKCTLCACQTGPPYSPFAGDRHQSAPGPPSIFCFQVFFLYRTVRCPGHTYGRCHSSRQRICLFWSYLKNIVEQINVVVHFLAVAIGCVNVATGEWSFWGLNICFDNMQFKLIHKTAS